MNIKTTNLNQIIASIILLSGDKNVGVFHLNKLAYLFEFFHIKNFGKRYTKEFFIKLPHGPVISNYKSKLIELQKFSICSFDLAALKKDRGMDDFNYEKIIISPARRTNMFSLSDAHPAFQLLSQIIDKYASLSCKEIETVVYETLPVKNYLTKVEQGYKKEIGGMVLKDCIPMTKMRSSVNPAIKMYYEHKLKFPDDDIEQMEITEKEFQFLEKMRPEFPSY